MKPFIFQLRLSNSKLNFLLFNLENSQPLQYFIEYKTLTFLQNNKKFLAKDFNLLQSSSLSPLTRKKVKPKGSIYYELQTSHRRLRRIILKCFLNIFIKNYFPKEYGFQMPLWKGGFYLKMESLRFEVY